MKPLALTLLFVFSLMLAGVDEATARILRVSPDGDGTDGLTWETAFTSISDALTASASGDEIWVASGTYNEAIALVDGVSLFGGFRGTESESEFHLRDWMTNEAVIDATGLNLGVVLGAGPIIWASAGVSPRGHREDAIA